MDELLLQLIAQTKEQQKEMDAMRSDLKKGLEQQEASIQELKEDIAKLHMQITRKLQKKKKKIEVQKPISDHPTLVWEKPLDGRDNDLETKASSTIRARAYMARTISQATSTDLETSQINSRLSTAPGHI